MGYVKQARKRFYRAVDRAGARILDTLEGLENDRWRAEKVVSFEKTHGYAANLQYPKTFSEKLLKRILDDEDPLYETYAVKHLAPHFVKGRTIDGLKVARHLKTVCRLEPSVFVDLPDSFVIKSSFGSALNEVVLRKRELNIPKVCNKFNSQLNRIRNAQNKKYRQNAVIIEEFIGKPDDGPPDDYKFHCFNSSDGSFSCFLQVDTGRFGEHRQTLFDQAFQPIDMSFARQVKHEKTPERPQRLEEMLRIARELSSYFDYIRVDLFDVYDGIYFGELTPFHQAATAPISPLEWEEHWGQLWEQKFPLYQPTP